METSKVKYQRAQKRVQEVKKFYKNVTKLVIFVIILGTLNYVGNGFENLWFLWIIGLMSIGLGIDAVRTFIRPLLFKGWERRKIEALMRNDAF